MYPDSDSDSDSDSDGVCEARPHLSQPLTKKERVAIKKEAAALAKETKQREKQRLKDEAARRKETIRGISILAAEENMRRKEREAEAKANAIEQREAEKGMRKAQAKLWSTAEKQSKELAKAEQELRGEEQRERQAQMKRAQKIEEDRQRQDRRIEAMRKELGGDEGDFELPTSDGTVRGAPLAGRQRKRGVCGLLRKLKFW